ncbi:MAG: Gfo/Idh/MocA family oxidoreductase [Gammaproteobacteria bacterium]|nr:Gfo/Idh/MocA family oxidoreductase [Gammaproteobacteria bacterium]
MKKCRVAVIGVGYLGQFHAEKFAHSPLAELVAVCDTHAERVKPIAEKYSVRATTDYKELMNQVDAVSIVVPTAQHHSICKDFLMAQKHVLLEKPMTKTIEQANDLIQCAQEQQCILQIGHLERFNPVVREMNSIVENPRYIQCTRISPFKPRVTDINVIHDVMIHDIELVLHWVKSPIKSITASGKKVLTERIDFANARIEFQNGCIANLTASRVSAKSQREIKLFQKNLYLEADLQNKKLFTHQPQLANSQEITMQEQSFEIGDALRDECDAFLTSIISKSPPVVSAEAGRAALSTALDITRIIADQLAQEQLGTQADALWVQNA